MHKFCNKCNTEKNIECFSINKTKRDGRESTCKDCRKKYAKQWYNNNKDLHKKRARSSNIKRQRDNRLKLIEYLSNHPCVDCGEDRPECLDFDHVHGVKRGNISTMVGNSLSWDRILEEIEKCEVRCANCHRVKISQQFDWYSKL